MANIGTFKKSGDGYIGQIFTLNLQTKNVRIITEAPATENGPSHRVFVGNAELGACWSKVSKEGRPYLSVKLDDPSLPTAIFATLFDDDDGKTFNLIWTRARPTNGN